MKSFKYVLSNISLRIMIEDIFQRREQMLHIVYKDEQKFYRERCA